MTIKWIILALIFTSATCLSKEVVPHEIKTGQTKNVLGQTVETYEYYLNDKREVVLHGKRVVYLAESLISIVEIYEDGKLIRKYFHTSHK